MQNSKINNDILIPRSILKKNEQIMKSRDVKDNLE